MRVAIQVSEVRWATEDGVYVLDNVSFGLPHDGFVFVVGPPASGKTLLLRLILREEVPTGGQILVLGRNVARLSPRRCRELRKRMGYVPEPLRLLSDSTVTGNLSYKLRVLGYRGKEAEEHRARALELAGIASLAQERVGELGELERRKLGLALALCPEPAVLLCDDPFRELPPQDQDALVHILSAVNTSGMAVLATTRDPGLPARHGFGPKGPAPALRYVFSLRPGVVR